jgi:hypothetical protein
MCKPALGTTDQRSGGAMRTPTQWPKALSTSHGTDALMNDRWLVAMASRRAQQGSESLGARAAHRRAPPANALGKAAVFWRPDLSVVARHGG